MHFDNEHTKTSIVKVGSMKIVRTLNTEEVCKKMFRMDFDMDKTGLFIFKVTVTVTVRTLKYVKVRLKTFSMDFDVDKTGLFVFIVSVMSMLIGFTYMCPCMYNRTQPCPH